ncbi:MAG TPA: helix-turn-helix transcriptional regulator [Mycobacteriales bacterium]|nr:helix-turn-helix transcriptional regulator [Mycobacteriales bacterium]
MRAALAGHDIRTVCLRLNKLGFTQQHIAALTGQSQPEICAVLKGRRVIAYTVLSRVADGLRVPRGYLACPAEGWGELHLERPSLTRARTGPTAAPAATGGT